MPASRAIGQNANSTAPSAPSVERANLRMAVRWSGGGPADQNTAPFNGVESDGEMG
jgi:hypothetical protein